MVEMKRPIQANRMERWALALGGVFGLGLLVAVWAACAHGLDLTDEGYYLVCMRQPWSFPSSVSLFGFVYYPLYQFLHGDVAALRRASVALSLGCAAIFGWAFLRKREDLAGPWLVVAAFLLAVQSLLQHLTSMPTPSYNTLALQGMLLALAGAALAGREGSAEAWAAPALLALGLVLTGLGKPTTGALLGLLLVARLAWDGPLTRWRGIRAALLAFALLLIAVFLISGGIPAFILRLRLGVEEYNALRLGPEMTRLLRFDHPDLTHQELSWAIGGAGIAAVAAWVGGRWPKRGLLIALLPLTVAALALGGFWNPHLIHTNFEGLACVAVPLSCALLGALEWRKSGLPTRTQCMDALLLGVMPWVYAIGTNRNYWMNEAYAVIFWSMAGLVLLPGKLGQRILGPALLVGLAWTGLLLQSASKHPYREAEPLFSQNTLVPYGGKGASLWLDDAQRDYFQALRGAAAEQGFKNGMPVLDMTGQSPGVLHGLGAKSVASPWFFGDYPGGQDRAAMVIDRVSCQELASMWVLTEPAGPRHIDLEILTRRGLDLKRDYLKVITLQSPLNSRGYPGSETQTLYRPKDAVALTRRLCKAQVGSR